MILPLDLNSSQALRRELLKMRADIAWQVTGRKNCKLQASSLSETEGLGWRTCGTTKPRQLKLYSFGTYSLVMMYNPNQTLADATTQDLWTALLLRRCFNNFEPTRIVQDLYAHSHLWQKFWLGWLVFDVAFYQKTREAPIARLLEMLVCAEDNRLHRNDVLYLQSSGDEAVPAILELSQQWQVDETEVYALLRRYHKGRARIAELLGCLTLLTEVLGAESTARPLAAWKSRTSCAPVVALWWD